MKITLPPFPSVNAAFLGTLAATVLAFSPHLSSAQGLVLQLQAADYDPFTGTWTAAAGPNAVQTDPNFQPSLVTGATPNGSAAVRFARPVDPVDSERGDFFDLSSAIPLGTSDFTVFVFLRPDVLPNSNGGTIFSGATGSFHYRISDLKQDIVRQGQADLRAGTNTLSTTAFSSINATTSTTGGTYRLNGAADGTNDPNGTFTAPITRIGAHANFFNGESFSGDIVEIRIYDYVMTDLERGVIEQEFTDLYINPIPVPEPGTWAMLLTGAGVLVLWRIRRRVA